MAKKTKVPFFQEVYRATWYGGYWNSYTWRLLFGGSKLAKLPVTSEVFEEVACTKYFPKGSTDPSDEMTLRVRLFLHPSGPKGCRSHRVFVACPRCKNIVPAGRIHQHTC